MAENKNGVRYILIALCLVALAVILWKISGVVTVAFGGIVGAAVLRGLALPLSRRTKLSEGWSITIVLIGLIVIFGLTGYLFGQQIADQTTQLERLVPQAVRDITTSLQKSKLGSTLVERVKQSADDSSVLSHLGLAAGALVGGIADALLIFFLSVYFAYNPREYLDGFLRLVPPRYRRRVESALVDSGEALLKWLLAQLSAMVVIGLLVGTGMAFLGLPLALLLGVVAGLLEFIPVVGALLFTIPGVLVAFTQGPETALYALLIYVGVQQLESNVVIPLFQRWAVRLPPAITLLSVVIGGILLSAPGVVFATPLTVVVMTLVKHLYVEDMLEHQRRKPV
ncbi:MAG TPA: AI-2E family transporter [Lacunisphaera sp.]|jgi:predicted PurR-regulated permease PerM